ncbi:MAG: acyltransferase [Clostridia bacterium]|nr:acyltransferase [Clostridia bacterium]
MNKFSIFCMKVCRRIINKVRGWYRKTSFLSGVKSYGENVHLLGPVYLWNRNVILGADINVYPNVTFWGSGNIEIGNNCEIGFNTVLYASQSIKIMDHVSIAADCYIIDSNHGIAKDKEIQSQESVCKGPVLIEEDVWLGAGVKVLSGVHIGKGAVIGAQALVNSDIPEYAIAVGVPARVVGYRK